MTKKNEVPLILKSVILQDKYTEYVCEKYDIQNKELTQTIIPSIEIDELKKTDWNITLIVGNSGSGKSTLLNEIKKNKPIIYDNSKACVSQFPTVDEETVCEIFHSVGLSSIPSFLQKPNELSNGEKARLDLAYLIINTPKDEIIVIDEFTSVVNRQVAYSMSYALQRYLRTTNRQAIIASCHFDIIEWLNPDIVFNLNKQNDGFVEAEHFIYKDSEAYNRVKIIDENEVLTDERNIN